jgi:enoyl reductase-like protein
MGGYLRKDTGSIIAARSELGEHIHEVNNRALGLWKEYDSVFKLPHKKRDSWLQEHRAELIQRRNTDSFNPWFPAKKDGRVV